MPFILFFSLECCFLCIYILLVISVTLIASCSEEWLILLGELVAFFSELLQSRGLFHLMQGMGSSDCESLHKL